MTPSATHHPHPEVTHAHRAPSCPAARGDRGRPFGAADQGRRVPRTKSLRTFDFDANPNIDPAVVNSLASGEWIKKSQPLCLIGDSGTGKSHMLIATGTEAAMQGYRERGDLRRRVQVLRAAPGRE